MMRHRGRRAAQLGFILLAAASCTTESIFDAETTSSTLTTRYVDGELEVNAAFGGFASSSGDYPGNSVAFINDGQRGSPQWAYWASSSSSTVYNCNYGNWWVRVDFRDPSGAMCIFGGCARTISEIDLFSLQNNVTAGDPTTSTTTSLYGNVDFHLSYCPEGVFCGSSLSSGWVDAPGGYITANNKARRSVSFAPVRATAVRASLDCAQSTYAYVVELEAWERQATPTCSTITPPARDDLPPSAASDNTTDTMLLESDRFWWRYFGRFGDTEPNGRPDDLDIINSVLSTNGSMSYWWGYGARAAALVRMYDLLAPVDLARARVYLDHLRKMSHVLLENRDDKRSNAQLDVLHNRMMPAWGGPRSEIGGAWAADPGMSALFTYPMAAYARRVADHPDWFCNEERDDAITFTTAVIETYLAFRPDIRFGDSRNADWWYYVDRFSTASPQLPMQYNEGLAFMKSLAELAAAADSELYRSSPEAGWLLYYPTEEAPRLIAKSMKFFRDDMQSDTLADGTIWWWWHKSKDDSRATEDLSHANHTMGTLMSVWENRGVLDALLARYGYSERVSASLDTTILNGIANTFLRRIYYFDYSHPSWGTLLTDREDGPNHTVAGSSASTPTPNYLTSEAKPDNGNASASNYVALAPFNYWVWIRARDATFNGALDDVPGCIGGGEVPFGENDCNLPALNVASHAALLRYRAFTGIDPTDDIVWGGPGWAIWTTVNGGYLAGTSAAVSSDWFIAGAGDFNGDGSSDILWRNSDGRLQIYLMREAQYLSTVSLGALDTSWAIKGVADVNGDNVTDIVFHHSPSRHVVIWLMGRSANVISRGSLGASPAGWAITGMGDFNHDGKSDLFWTLRNPPSPTQTAIWLLNGTQVAGSMSLSTSTIASSYSFKGIGRLNDKYADDIIWRNSNGSVLTWRSTSISGSVVNISQVNTGWPGTEWDLRTVADINGDAISDFVWMRSSDRRVEGWLLNSSGGLVQSTLLGYTDPGWSIKASGTFD